MISLQRPRLHALKVGCDEADAIRQHLDGIVLCCKTGNGCSGQEKRLCQRQGSSVCSPFPDHSLLLSPSSPPAGGLLV